MDQQQFDNSWFLFRNNSSSDLRFPLRNDDLIPVLDEDTSTHTHKEFVWDYLLHCAWAARKVSEGSEGWHYDFGSYLYFAYLVSAFTDKFVFCDLRPIDLPVSNLQMKREDLTKLSFPDNSLRSISCLHVLEHVGLGRYGDEIDPSGDEKAASELVRVLATGGSLLIVLPMNATPRLNFNAHRIYSEEQVAALFPLRVVESVYLWGEAMHTNPPESGDYTGCFEFTK